MEKKKSNGFALLPILVFLVLYIGCGIYYEYINPSEGQNGFYVMSVVVSFMISIVIALVQNRKVKLDDKFKICAKGLGDDNIVIMIFIFLVAGAFSGIASQAGGATSTANLLLSIIPPRFAVVGLFVIASIISMAMGTSCGTITVLVPIAVSAAASADLNLPLCIGSVVGGAMFGDNLSFISDTTIAATKTQGCKMKDKFKQNFAIALPAALVTIVVLIVISFQGGAAEIGTFDFNIWQALPYFVILIAALCGINVFIVLGGGVVLFAIIGLATGSLSVDSALSSMGTGSSGMYETIIVAVLVACLGALIKENGGFEFILNVIKKCSKGQKGGQLGIGVLVGLMDIATANNTIAIVMAAPIAKNISEEYNISPQKTASLLDTFSCIFQGIIPYGAQLLIAAGLTKAVSTIDIIPYLFYPFLLLVSSLIFIFIIPERKKSK